MTKIHKICFHRTKFSVKGEKFPGGADVVCPAGELDIHLSARLKKLSLVSEMSTAAKMSRKPVAVLRLSRSW